MSAALQQIINGYLKLGDVVALEKMKAHRQKLIFGVGTDGPFDRSSLLSMLHDEVALIDAGLKILTGPPTPLSTQHDGSAFT